MSGLDTTSQGVGEIAAEDLVASRKDVIGTQRRGKNP